MFIISGMIQSCVVISFYKISLKVKKIEKREEYYSQIKITQYKKK